MTLNRPLTCFLSVAVLLLSVAQIHNFHHHLHDGHYSSFLFSWETSLSSSSGRQERQMTVMDRIHHWILDAIFDSPATTTARDSNDYHDNDEQENYSRRRRTRNAGGGGRRGVRGIFRGAKNMAAASKQRMRASLWMMKMMMIAPNKKASNEAKSNEATNHHQSLSSVGENVNESIAVRAGISTPPTIINEVGNTATNSNNNETIHQVQRQQPKPRPQPPPPLDSSCSCWNPSYVCYQIYNKTCWKEAEKCCRRTIHVSHKMGVVMTKNLIHWRVLTGVRQDINPPHYSNKRYFDPARRFQHRAVLVVRNLVDTLVSGYLYHKSGQECWLDGFGRKPKEGSDGGVLHGVPWDKIMTKRRKDIPWNRTVPAVPVRGRDICEYLAEESETEGMAAYVEFVMGYWYARMYEFNEAQKEHEDPDYNPMTMTICYDDLASDDDPINKERTIHKIMQWLHPRGGYRMNLALLRQQQTTNKTKQFAASHATDPDPELRGRLREIVRKLDGEAFRGFIARTDEEFGCPSSSSSSAHKNLGTSSSSS